MSNSKSEDFSGIQDSKNLIVEKLSGVIRRASKLLPWKFNCFEKALAGKFYLKQKGISSTIYFGVRTDDKGNELKAHAWLKVGDTFISGFKSHDVFTVVNTYS